VNLPSVGKMIRCKHPEHHYDIYAEIVQHRLSDDEHVVDLDWFSEHNPPVRVTAPLSYVKASISAVEISRVFSVRSKAREVTFEDTDKFADKKKFINFQ
jgi:hypothetical protein